VDNSHKPVFQRCLAEEAPCVLQIGTATPELALKAALHAYEDYDALDINCGCPKHFSVHSGMGAALLKEPDRIINILTLLLQHIKDKPVTCKIRLLDTVEETANLVRRIAKTGVRAIAIHARYIPQRPREPAHLHLLKQVVESVQNEISIPLIANGDAFTHEDIAKVKAATGCSSVMIARGAMWNASVFSKQPLSQWHVAQRFVALAQKFELPHQGIKYITMKMFENHSKTKLFIALSAAKSTQEFVYVNLFNSCLYSCFKTHTFFCECCFFAVAFLQMEKKTRCWQ